MAGIPAHQTQTQTFYDDLAADYHHLYGDWNASVTRQGAALDALIRRELGPGPQRVWDCACGIGTQSLGLAALGHEVVGTDLSPNAVARAAEEAGARSLPLRVAVADMRRLPVLPGSFDAVLCADNSLAHLLTEEDVDAALGAMRQALRAEGLLVISMRAYDQVRADHPTSTVPQVTRTDAGRVISFQLWHWHPDGEHYDLEHFQLLPTADDGTEGADGAEWQVHTRRATSWAITPAQLTARADAAGFSDITWHRPEDSGYFQPLLTARKGG
ncbi:class I SAM-dependent methyltransferase [Streptacidiphilus cavernicola]|uniref:Class I SAM-dependent methyltransferase n=1 Tax=Streptacidiphilus cavernicola TaxID=3342716 RepID=A0ABV6W6L7_9ACTN